MPKVSRQTGYKNGQKPMVENAQIMSTEPDDAWDECDCIEQASAGSGKTLVAGTLLKIVLAVFVVEAWVMLLIHYFLPNKSGLNFALLDASALAIAATPILYYWVVAPLRHQLQVTLVSLNRAKREAEQLALRDSLTKLLNRRALFEIFDQEWSRAERTENSLACIMLDIDRFKEVNDTQGHLVGDKVLSRVACILEQQCRKSDSVGRYGGEEFCAILPDTNKEQAVTIAERIRKAIKDMDVSHESKRTSVTVSLGIAERNTGTLTVQELIDEADQALLLAKRSGRNCTVASDTVSKKPDSKEQEELVGLR